MSFSGWRYLQSYSLFVKALQRARIVTCCVLVLAERKLATQGVAVAMMLGGLPTDASSVKARRLCVFKSLLKLLTPEQKFTVAARMAQDVLAAVVDGILPLTDSVRVQHVY